ncbi:hypothetical protein BGX27_002049 [Mortierella sp. AM989]|nr:hypothetical protein BGX27_002049 [Mortierella sp. AM989]
MEVIEKLSNNSEKITGAESIRLVATGWVPLNPDILQSLASVIINLNEKFDAGCMTATPAQKQLYKATQANIDSPSPNIRAIRPSEQRSPFVNRTAADIFKKLVNEEVSFCKSKGVQIDDDLPSPNTQAIRSSKQRSPITRAIRPSKQRSPITRAIRPSRQRSPFVNTTAADIFRKLVNEEVSPRKPKVAQVDDGLPSPNTRAIRPSEQRNPITRANRPSEQRSPIVNTTVADIFKETVEEKVESEE